MDYHRLGWAPVFSRCPLFYAYAALGLAQRVALQQAARGIGTETTCATLWDIGQQVFLHHRIYRAVGMDTGPRCSTRRRNQRSGRARLSALSGSHADTRSGAPAGP
jgi:hypothetical protein